MREKVAWVIVGLLVGMLVATVLPAGAHHRDEDQARKIRNLQRVVYNHTNDIHALEGKTRYIDSDGFYTAPISQFQVLSLQCATGDDAVWVQDPEFADVRFVGCTTGPYSSTGQRDETATERFLKKR